MTTRATHQVISGLVLGVTLLVGVLFIGQRPTRVQAQAPIIPIATISPASLSANLCESQCLRETVTIQLPPRVEPVINQMDVVFILDISGSMRNVLDTVTEESSNIADSLRAFVDDTRFAVGVFSDYVDVPWDLPVDFTTNLSTLNTGLRGIDLKRGGDDDESYGRALWESDQLAWREDTVKIIVLFTDAEPHDPDKGRDGLPGTADDIQMSSVLASLKAHGIRVITIKSGGGSGTTSALQTVANGTDGSYFAISNISDLQATVTRAISDELAELRLTFHVKDSTHSGWFTQDPGSFNYPENSAPIDVVLEFCPANFELSRGTYNIDLLLQELTTTYGTLPATVNYAPVCNALLIPDTAEDAGDGCATAPFWQSPSIVIRYGADGGTTSQPIRPDYPHSVYVSVKNNGFEAANGVRVTLRQADGLLSDTWSDLGQQTINIPVGETIWAGPFAWTPTSTTIALSAIAQSDAIPLRSDLSYYCDSQQAQFRQTILPLDNFSLNSNTPAGLLPLTPLQTNQGLKINTDGLSADGFIGWESADGQSKTATNRDRTLTIGASDNATQMLFSTNLFHQFSVMIMEGREVVQGADIIVQPQSRQLSGDNSTIISDAAPSFIPPIELLYGLIGVLTGIVVIVAIFTLVKRKAE